MNKGNVEPLLPFSFSHSLIFPMIHLVKKQKKEITKNKKWVKERAERKEKKVEKKKEDRHINTQTEKRERKNQ